MAERRLYPATVAWALAELGAGRAIHPEAEKSDAEKSDAEKREEVVEEMKS